MLMLPLPSSPWTVEDLANIPSSDIRVELDEGKLIIMPAAMAPWHARTQFRLLKWFEREGWHALHEPGLILERGGRTPDIGVFREEPDERAYHPASDYLVAVEIVSPSTAQTDYEVKPALYAAAGIPAYWLVDQHPDTEQDATIKIHELRLVRGPAYVCTHTFALTELESGGLPR
jgi:Uma2 family endonuclease